MKFQLADGETLQLKPLSDVEYELARRMATKSLDICPTCGGRDRMVEGSGMKMWDSPGYDYQGEHHECNCHAQIALYTRYILANIGEQYMRLDWHDFSGSPEAGDWVRDYLDKWRSFLAHGFGLAFASPIQGVGKTWATTTIGKELIKRRQKVYFLDFTEMVDAFCGDQEQKRAIESRMRETTFLILDDVRAGISERQTDLYALKFEVVIRHRTNFNLPTIFSTNLTEDAFEMEFPRIHSLLAFKQAWVQLTGEDFRKGFIARSKVAEMIMRGEVRPIT